MEDEKKVSGGERVKKNECQKRKVNIVISAMVKYRGQFTNGR